MGKAVFIRSSSYRGTYKIAKAAVQVVLFTVAKWIIRVSTQQYYISCKKRPTVNSKRHPFPITSKYMSYLYPECNSLLHKPKVFACYILMLQRIEFCIIGLTTVGLKPLLPLLYPVKPTGVAFSKATSENLKMSYLEFTTVRKIFCHARFSSSGTFYKSNFSFKASLRDSGTVEFENHNKYETLQVWYVKKDNTTFTLKSTEIHSTNDTRNISFGDCRILSCEFSRAFLGGVHDVFPFEKSFVLKLKL